MATNTRVLSTENFIFQSTVGPGSGEQSPPDTKREWFIVSFNSFPIREDSGTSACVSVLWATRKGKVVDSD